MTGSLGFRYWPFVILTALGLLTRFAFIGYPNEVVFDEVHFGKFVSAYYTGEYYFDIHPPLGKLMIAGFAKFFGFRAGFDFDKIGQIYGEIPYVALRFLPNLAGALIPAAVFGWLTSMGIAGAVSFLVAWALLFDNAYLTQSRFVLVDAFLLLFGFAGLWMFFASRNRGYDIKRLAVAALFLGLSVSVKWTGLGFWGLAVLILLYDEVYTRFSRLFSGNIFKARERLGSFAQNAVPMLYRLVLFIVIPCVIYLAVFWVHFEFLPKSGPGDPFMSPRFLRNLEGSAYYGDELLKPLNIFEKAIEINKVMFSANQGLRAQHSYSSEFYTWPVMTRPVFYWVKYLDENMAARVYLIGNPFVWWGSSVGIMLALFFWKPKEPKTKWLLYAGYVMNIAPFSGVERVLFLYHYLVPLAFAVSITAGWIFEGSRVVGELWWTILITIAAAFLFFAPFSYGWPLGEFWYRMRIWMPGWV